MNYSDSTTNNNVKNDDNDGEERGGGEEELILPVAVVSNEQQQPKRNHRNYYGMKQKRTWEESYQALQKYKEKHGDCLVSIHNCTEDPTLGGWVNHQRSKKDKLTQKQRAKLDSIGFVWIVRERNKKWNEMMDALKKYSPTQIMNLDFPAEEDDKKRKLLNFIQEQQIKYQKGQLSATRQSQLEEIGLVFKKTTEEARSVLASDTRASRLRPARRRQRSSPQRKHKQHHQPQPERAISNTVISPQPKKLQQQPNKKRQRNQPPPHQKYLIGKTLSKEFPPHGIFAGRISKYNPKTALYFVTYEDGDTEEMDQFELDRTFKRMQNHTQPYTNQKHKLGTTFLKRTPSRGLLEGTITSYTAKTGVYKIVYDRKKGDGDDHDELLDEYDIDRQLAITASLGSSSSGASNKEGPLPPKPARVITTSSSSSSSSCDDNLEKRNSRNDVGSIEERGSNKVNPAKSATKQDDGPPQKKKIRNQKHPLGTTFQKQQVVDVGQDDEQGGVIEGTVVHYSTQTGLYKIKFQKDGDGDVEEEEEMDEIDLDIALLVCSKSRRRQQQQQQVVADPTLSHHHHPQKHPLGMTFQKEFFGFKDPFEGTIADYSMETGLYKIKYYQDDDEEELDEYEIDRLLASGKNGGNHDDAVPPLASAAQQKSCSNNRNETELNASSSSSGSTTTGTTTSHDDEVYGEDYADDDDTSKKKKKKPRLSGGSNYREELFMKQYNHLLEFKRVHGHCRVPQGEKFRKLGLWVNNLRVMYNRDPENGVRPDRRKMLDQIGFVWNAGIDRPDREAKWDEQYKNLVEFRNKFSHCRVPQTGSHRKLGRWVGSQRALRVKDPINGIRPDRLKLLNDIGFTWDARGFKGKHFYSMTTADEVGKISPSNIELSDSGSLAPDERGTGPSQQQPQSVNPDHLQSKNDQIQCTKETSNHNCNPSLAPHQPDQARVASSQNQLQSLDLTSSSPDNVQSINDQSGNRVHDQVAAPDVTSSQQQKLQSIGPDHVKSTNEQTKQTHQCRCSPVAFMLVDSTITE